ncbi:MAG: hypothetical protein R3A46_04950 [Thermomicrobiales bacterium]
MTDSVLYFGGPILTMDPASPEAEAVATIGDRIVAVGSIGDASRCYRPDSAASIFRDAS